MNLLQPFDNNIQLLEKVLDLRAQKQEVISSNIANAETPGYSATRFDFEKELQTAVSNNQQMTTTHSNHMPTDIKNFDDVQGQLSKKDDSHGIGDKNNVSVRDEMLALSENQLLYEASTQLLNKKLAMLKYAISGGQ